MHVCTYTHGSLALTPIISPYTRRKTYFSGFSDGLLLKKAKKQGEMPGSYCTWWSLETIHVW